MINNRQVYCNFRMAIRQVYPTEPRGILIRVPNNLVALISRIVLSRY